MNGYLLAIFIITGFLCFGLLATIWFNIKAGKSNRTSRLNYSTVAFVCVLAAFGYYVYWINNADWFRSVLSIGLGVHAVLLLLLVFVASKHVKKAENFPSVLRMNLVTFMLVHFLLPAFPINSGTVYVFFKFITDAVVATICFMSAIFLFFLNNKAFETIGKTVFKIPFGNN